MGRWGDGEMGRWGEGGGGEEERSMINYSPPKLPYPVFCISRNDRNCN
ncbi:MAG: hypothetical protein F6K36_14785 [Symploca sp. SIO3C6]|nr:hypothetical protein [Symploca sp. SIO3C6]